MSRALLAYAALAAGCNQVYGLDGTQLARDASPTECPPFGTAPRFGRTIRQAVQQHCTNYHFNADGSLATAYCTFDTNALKIAAGRRDEPLGPVAALQSGNGVFHFFPQPSPLRRRIYVQHVTNEAPTVGIAAFDETASGAWMNSGRIPVPYTSNQRFSSVFRGPTGDRLVLYDGDPAHELVEYEEDGATWVLRATRPRIPHFNGVYPLSITSDGLRVIFLGDDGMRMFYADRPDLESWFGDATPLDGLPAIVEMHMTDDCTRIYYPGLESIFYSQQI